MAMFNRGFIIFSLLLVGIPAHAQSLFVTLANNSARFFYNTEMTGQATGRLDLELGYLYTDSSDSQLSAGLLVRNDNLDSPMVISVGARGYYSSVSDPTLGSYRAMAITIGGEVIFIPDTWGGIGIGVHYFAAPNVTSFMDAKSFVEYGAKLEYQITPQAAVFIGYQRIGFTTGATNTEILVDHSTHMGIGVRF